MIKSSQIMFDDTSRVLNFQVDGPESGKCIRDAKVKVLNAISPVTMDECFLAQYEGTF